MLLFSLAILITLLADVVSGGLSVLTERGGDFLTKGLSSLPERAGVWQGIVGSLLMMFFVVIVAFPLGVGAAVYLEEYSPDTRFGRFIIGEYPKPRRRSFRRLRTPWVSHSSCS